MCLQLEDYTSRETKLWAALRQSINRTKLQQLTHLSCWDISIFSKSIFLVFIEIKYKDNTICVND